MNRLILHITATLDGDCRLSAEVQSNEFRGAGSSCFLPEEVLAFASKLVTHSIPRDAPAVLQGGYWDRSGELLETHFYLAAYPINALDGVGMKVRLCTPPHQHERSESQHQVEIELETDYGALAEFGRQIKDLIAGHCSEAVLT